MKIIRIIYLFQSFIFAWITGVSVLYLINIKLLFGLEYIVSLIVLGYGYLISYMCYYFWMEEVKKENGKEK